MFICLLIFSSLYVKVCAKWARQRKKILVKNKNERLLRDVEQKLRDCHRLFAEIGVCICHSSSNLEELFHVRNQFILMIFLELTSFELIAYNVFLWWITRNILSITVADSPPYFGGNWIAWWDVLSGNREGHI